MKDLSNLPHTMASMIQIFMDNFDQMCYPCPEQTPPAVAILRGNLINEETIEYGRAPWKTTEELDAICDLLYVTIGTNLALGVPIHHYYPEKSFKSLPAKISFYSLVKGACQDLWCRFPCLTIQTRELNLITEAIITTALRSNYDLLGAFKAVHASNMSKLWDDSQTIPVDVTRFTAIKKPAGWLVKSSDGKVIKPPTFTPPDLTPYMSVILPPSP